jgi:hypothetical protein
MSHLSLIISRVLCSMPSTTHPIYPTTASVSAFDFFKGEKSKPALALKMRRENKRGVMKSLRKVKVHVYFIYSLVAHCVIWRSVLPVL